MLISLCDAIIRDDATISRAERELHGAHADATRALPAQLAAQIANATTDADKKLDELTGKRETTTAFDFSETDALTKRLSQLSEMSTSVVSATNSAIAAMAKNVKG
ncbi:MAG: DUF5407 family protein [Solirubrobacterales bacterium]|nr:DUF5407 family protein [Solirubrobacterales bacterium]MBV8992083.1 DUF5407 family protein [Solirubrobacterales bacterium]